MTSLSAIRFHALRGWQRLSLAVLLFGCGTGNRNTGGNGDASAAVTPAGDAAVGGAGGGAGADAVGGDAGEAAAGSSVDLSDAGVPVDAANVGPGEPLYVSLFDPETLPEFRIVLSAEAIDALTLDPNTYQTASLEYAGHVYENVGLRLKGRASFQGFDQKPALKIKLDAFQADQRLEGLKRLTLNNMTQDASMAHEVLGYALLRAAGIPAPRCNHARVFINDTYYGLYANVQSLDEVFVSEVFPGEVGNLFDTNNAEYFVDIEREIFPPAQETKFVLETNQNPADISDLTALIDAVSTGPGASWMIAAEQHMNLEQVLMLGAVQAVMADWDGYFGARNNYKLYHDTQSDKFVVFPWGIDQSFQYLQLEYAIDHSMSNRPRSIVYDRCAYDAACVARYQDKVQSALEIFEELPLEVLLDALLAQAATAIAVDARKPYSLTEHQTAVDELRAFLHERPASVRAQLPP